MRSTRMLLPLFLLGLCPAAARAQTLSEQAIAQINAAAEVRVRIPSGKRRTLHAPQADSISVRYTLGDERDRAATGPRQQAVLLTDVVEIERPTGNHLRKGAILGGLIFGGYVLLLDRANIGWGPASSSQTARDTFMATLIGAGIGALIGIGSKRWETVYRASCCGP